MPTKSKSKPRSKPTSGSPAPEAISDEDAAIDALIVRIGTGRQGPAARAELRGIEAAKKVPRLIRFFTDHRPKVRGNAYEIATSHADERALVPIELLIAGADDPDRGVRMSILLCYNRAHGATNAAAYAAQREAFRAALEKLRADPEPMVAKQAAIVWGRLGLT